jgi:hypothetical protein
MTTLSQPAWIALTDGGLLLQPGRIAGARSFHSTDETARIPPAAEGFGPAR